MNIYENLEKIEDGLYPIYATKSVYDIFNLIKNKPQNYRILFDSIIDYWFIGDGNVLVHTDLMEAACETGLYHEQKIKNRFDLSKYINKNRDSLCFITFNVNDDYYTELDRSEDDYTHKYYCKYGVLFTRDYELGDTELYDLLDVEDSEYLGESFNYLTKRLKTFIENTESLQNTNIFNKDKQTQENFWKWFKGSKIVDEQGNPLICYHGTPNGGFDTFKQNSHFTTRKEYADIYQNQGASSISYKKTANNPMTYAVYLCIKNPFDTRDEKAKDIFLNEYQAYYSPDLTDRGMVDWFEAEELGEWLQENHPEYDGLIVDEGGTGGYGYDVQYRGIAYIPFKPNQIKSINNTKFSNSNNINEESALYKSNQPTFKDFYNYVIKNPKAKKSYFGLFQNRLRIPSDTILHDYKKHTMTLEHWDDVISNILNIENCCISNKRVSNNLMVLMRILGFKDYGISLMCCPNYFQITTCFYDKIDQIDNWIEVSSARSMANNPPSSLGNNPESVVLPGRQLNNIIQQLKHFVNNNINEDYFSNYLQQEDTINTFLLLQEFIDDKQQGIKQYQWNVIPKQQYHNALKMYKRDGKDFKFPQRTLENWLNLICHNIMVLDIMTELAGHSTWFPTEDINDAFGIELNGYEDGWQFLDSQGFYDWCILPDGSDAISDYGRDPIIKILCELTDYPTSEQMLIAINRCLDVTHHRGDLASAFIEGGAKSCEEISNG